MPHSKNLSGKFTPKKFYFKKGKLTYKLTENLDMENSYFLYELSEKQIRYIGRIILYDFLKQHYWLCYTVIHHNDGSGTSESFVYKGQIPSDAFAKQLFQNIFL